MSETAPGSIARRLAWFAAIWAASVATIAAVAGLLRLWLS